MYAAATFFLLHIFTQLVFYPVPAPPSFPTTLPPYCYPLMNNGYFIIRYWTIVLYGNYSFNKDILKLKMPQMAVRCQGTWPSGAHRFGCCVCDSLPVHQAEVSGPGCRPFE